MPRPKDKYGWTVTVGEKGQIVIPKQARDLFGIEPGDTLLLLADGRVPSGDLMRLAGLAREAGVAHLEIAERRE